jgi:hypothetical protein
MADTAKKAKTTTKPSATTTKTAIKTPAKTATKKVETVTSSKPTREEIERLAKTYWAERGGHNGSAEQDWLRAEKELLKAASAKKAS